MIEGSTRTATVGSPPELADPRDHLELGTARRAIDTERGAKVSGSRFYLLTGVGAQLELALVNLAMAQADQAGFTPMIAPALVKPETMEGTGFLGAHADKVYRLANDELYLVGTSEVALAGYHADLGATAPRFGTRAAALVSVVWGGRLVAVGSGPAPGGDPVGALPDEPTRRRPAQSVGRPPTRSTDTQAAAARQVDDVVQETMSWPRSMLGWPSYATPCRKFP